MDTLRRIYNRKPRTSGWYKKDQRKNKDEDKNSGAQCPDDRTLSVSESYWNEFGCSPLEQPFKRGEKSRAAKTCASERMANMRYHISDGRPADDGHVHPIKIAYGLGKQCLQIPGTPGSVEQYKRAFRTWYDELIDRSNPTHALFQEELKTADPYPLNAYNPNTNNEITAAKRANPIQRGTPKGATTKGSTPKGATTPNVSMTPLTPDNKMYESTPNEMWTHVSSSKKLKSTSKKTTRRRKRTPPKHD
jgi:hypothetical protein